MLLMRVKFFSLLHGNLALALCNGLLLQPPLGWRLENGEQLPRSGLEVKISS